MEKMSEDLIQTLNTENFDDTEKSQMRQLAEQDMLLKNILDKKNIIPEYFDGIHCIDCDDEIPEKRLKIGAYRCIDCQTYFEKHKNKQV